MGLVLQGQALGEQGAALRRFVRARDGAWAGKQLGWALGQGVERARAPALWASS